MKRARLDLEVWARALLAFQRGGSSDEAFLGALLTAEHQSLIRHFLTAKPKNKANG